MNKKLVFGILLIATIILLAVNFSQYLTLDNAKAQQLALNSFIDENFLFASISYFVIYVGLTAFSVPGATVVTLLGAALFGFWYSLL
ncbi:TVP38/TMEM64 family protein, partial [Vibrio vulnificus]